jgi:hypothetical protein
MHEWQLVCSLYARYGNQWIFQRGIHPMHVEQSVRSNASRAIKVVGVVCVFLFAGLLGYAQKPDAFPYGVASGEVTSNSAIL